MKFYDDIDNYNENKRTVLTLGKFDGFHRGHQRLIQKVLELKTEELKSLVLSINLNEYKMEQGYEIHEIMDTQEKIDFLENKVDYYMECQFTDELRNTTALEFVEKTLVEKFKVAHLVVGQGFQFGAGGEGNITFLREMALKYNFQLHVVNKLSYGFESISSTFVRMEVKQGRMEIVNDLLGYNYGIQGEVIHGAKLGRSIGFPTLNIQVPKLKVMPPRGVYICSIVIDGNRYYGMGNLGCKPTVSTSVEDLLEVHVLDYDEDTYGKVVKVEFIKYLRIEQKFEDLNKLMQQIRIDLAETERYIFNTCKHKNPMI